MGSTDSAREEEAPGTEALIDAIGVLAGAIDELAQVVHWVGERIDRALAAPPVPERSIWDDVV